MHRLVGPALLALVLAGPAVAETRPVSGFDEVHASDRLTVEVAIGPAYAVEVSGSDADRVRTQVRGDALHVYDARRPWFGTRRELDAVVRVTMPELSGVAAARGAELRASLSGSCNNFSAAAAMGGYVTIDGLHCDSVDASAAMGGVVRLEGACDMLDVSAAMGGEVRAGRLQCELVDASAAMGGDIHAFASRSYDASAAMGGAINVAGGAHSADQSAVMGGEVTRNPD